MQQQLSLFPPAECLQPCNPALPVLFFGRAVNLPAAKQKDEGDGVERERMFLLFSTRQRPEIPKRVL